jgi:hypothetical protein
MVVSEIFTTLYKNVGNFKFVSPTSHIPSFVTGHEKKNAALLSGQPETLPTSLIVCYPP